MKGERLAGFDEAVLQHAKRIYLQSRPLTDADRVGQYAYLHHKTILAPACCLYFLDKKYRLLEAKILYSGVILPVEDCCSYLSDRIAALRAAHVVWIERIWSGRAASPCSAKRKGSLWWMCCGLMKTVTFLCAGILAQIPMKNNNRKESIL